MPPTPPEPFTTRKIKVDNTLCIAHDRSSIAVFIVTGSKAAPIVTLGDLNLVLSEIADFSAIYEKITRNDNVDDGILVRIRLHAPVPAVEAGTFLLDVNIAQPGMGAPTHTPLWTVTNYP